MQRLKTILSSNATANALLGVTCIVVLWTFLAGSSSSLSPSVRAIEGVWPAETAAPLDLSLDAASPRRSIVLFVHSQCRYCSQEMAFYRELQTLARGRAVRFYAASVEGPAELRNYLETNGLTEFEALPNTSVPALPATPTILVADESGLVQQSWRGVLSESQKAELKGLL